MSKRSEVQPEWSVTQVPGTPNELFQTDDVLQFGSVGAVTLVQSGSVAINSDLSGRFALDLTTGAGFSLPSPTGSPVEGQLLQLTISNSSGGAAGALTLGAGFAQVTLALPADTKHRTYAFQWTGAIWDFLWETDQDVPN